MVPFWKGNKKGLPSPESPRPSVLPSTRAARLYVGHQEILAKFGRELLAPIIAGK